MSFTLLLFVTANSTLEFYLTENLCRPKKQKSVPSNSQFRSDNREIDRTDNINKKDKESFWEKESESNSPSVDELLKGLNMKNETVGDTRPLYELYPDWYSPISDYSDYSDYDEY